MNSISSIAISGMQAAQQRLQSSAHNVANLATENFQREEVSARPRSGGGVDVRVQQAPTSGTALEKDMVDQLQAKNAFLANLKVFKTADSLAGALLNKKA